MKVFATLFVVLFFCLSCSSVKHSQPSVSPIKINKKIEHPSSAPAASLKASPVNLDFTKNQTLYPFLYIVIGSIILCSSLSLLNLKKRVKESAIH